MYLPKKWIAKLDPTIRINSTGEFVSKCHHKRKFKLGRIEDTEGVDLMKYTLNPCIDKMSLNNQEIKITILRRSQRTRRKPQILNENERVK